MRWQWKKPPVTQLDLLDAACDTSVAANAPSNEPAASSAARPETQPLLPATTPAIGTSGRALMVLVTSIDEDANNPRTEFPESEDEELADDIRERGILQPLVVHPADAAGRYRIHFGAKRLRAAKRAGLNAVPVVVRDAPADPYAQVAENQKRHGLTPLDLANFIRVRVNAGESNATIAKRLGMDLTSVAHHLALLVLPAELDEAMRTGRCTSPRTLYELSKLHQSQPEDAKALAAGNVEITRVTVAAARDRRARSPSSKPAIGPAISLLAEINDLCARLERAMDRMKVVGQGLAPEEMLTLRRRIADLSQRLA